MKITQSDISINDFQRAFIDANRGNQFSNEGLDGLYEYLTEFENDIGEEYELDVIALCCAYSEYNSVDEYLANYCHSTKDECLERVVANLYSGGVIIEDW
tara:strand:- start:482 stop:781 length:300 start_codon:yes stop_codon:yes gene_type:complete